MIERSYNLKTKRKMLMIIPVVMLFLIVTPVAAGVLTDWTQVTGSADFSGRYDHTSVVYDGKMWVINGLNLAYFGTTTLQDSRNSTNGVSWLWATGMTGFSGRRSHSSVVYDSKMWVIGGLNIAYNNGTTIFNDVWYSDDGITWSDATASAAFSDRQGHTSVVYDGKMWVIGGNDGSYLNDVWYSTDGTTWTQATASAAFSGRQAHTSVVYDGKMWVIGGYGGGYFNDAWYSTDGVTWTQATSSAGFSPRSGHTSVVYDGKMWVIGGYGGGYFNDVWYSTDGVTWTQATSSAGFSGRHSHTSVVYDGKVWVIGGYDGSCLNDVWYSGGGTASTVIIDNGSISEPGGETSVTLILDTAPNGLSGYNLEVSLENSSVAEITGVTFPYWAAVMNSHGTLPATRDLMIRASDTGYAVEPGASDITLVTLILEGLNPGSTVMSISDTNFDDDDGNDIHPSVITGTVTVDYTPTLLNITPSSGYNNGSVNVTLTGTWLMSGATVNLTRPGSVIAATNLSYTPYTRIDGVFNLTGQDAGDWNVTVTNPDGKNATLTDGFTIVRPLIPINGVMPTDPNEDGKYEDLNGNGQADYADVNIFFIWYSWIYENEPEDAFDFNNNGRLDMGDIVTLFDSVS